MKPGALGIYWGYFVEWDLIAPISRAAYAGLPDLALRSPHISEMSSTPLEATLEQYPVTRKN
jgi:hypothetical protein